jgi:hypothetical protein
MSSTPIRELPDELSTRNARNTWFQYLRLTTGAFGLAIFFEFGPQVPRIGEWAYLSLVPVPLLAVYAYLVIPWAYRTRFIKIDADRMTSLIKAYESYSFGRISGLGTAVFVTEVGFLISGIWPILYAAIGVYLLFLLELPTHERARAWFLAHQEEARDQQSG